MVEFNKGKNPGDGVSPKNEKVKLTPEQLKNLEDAMEEASSDPDQGSPHQIGGACWSSSGDNP